MENRQKMISNMHFTHIELLQKLLEKVLDIAEKYRWIISKPGGLIQQDLKSQVGYEKHKSSEKILNIDS